MSTSAHTINKFDADAQLTLDVGDRPANYSAGGRSSLKQTGIVSV